MTRLVTAISLDRAGDHPAAWREDGVDPAALLAISRLRGLVERAEAAGVDLVTVPDALGPDPAAGGVPARLDAVQQLAAIAPLTARIGLVPTVTTTHTEPFHLQAAIASLDFASLGRAGWLVEVSATEHDAAVVGRRSVAAPGALWQEAADVIDVGRLLWDSWEDDAEIRDVSTGRFIDRDKLHHVDFHGATFSVKGPSIVPRPPQGHPVTAVRLADEAALPAAARADLVLVPADGLAGRLPALRAAIDELGRDRAGVRVLADVRVVLDGPTEPAAQRAARLDARAADGARTVVGSAAALVEQIGDWHAAGADGVHLRPAVLPTDLDAVLDEVLPALRDAGLVGAPPAGPVTLRDRLGLNRPANTFATARHEEAVR